MSEGTAFRLKKNMSRAKFEGILEYLNYTDQKDVEYYDGFFQIRKMEEP